MAKESIIMRLNIVNLGLSEFFDRKSDILYGLFHALSSLGYETAISHNSLKASDLNLIIGSDVAAGDAGAVQQISKNIDYIIYEVENFNGKTVNYRENFNLTNYQKLLSSAKFVITPYFYNVKNLQTFLDKDKIIYARWGFHERMISSNIVRNNDFQYDALFFGLIKGSRVEKYKMLVDHFGEKIKILTANDPFTNRDYGIISSRFGLSLSYGDTDNFVNPFRIYYMVANGLPVLSDHVADDDDYQDICTRVSFDNLFAVVNSAQQDPKNLQDNCRKNSLIQNLRGII